MNRARMGWLLVVLAVLLWILAIYPGYYVVHKPLTAENLRALVNVAADLLTWLAMLAVATALGARLTRRLTYHSLLEKLTFSAGLGLLVVSLLTLGLGLAGLLYGWLFWGLLAGGGLLLWRELRDLGRAVRRLRFPWPHDRWLAFLTLFCAATLLLALVLALLPPVEWDALTYHLAGPERYLHNHRLTPEFDIYYLFFPAFSEMLFTAGMALKGDVVAHLLHYGFLLLTLGAVGAFAARYWQPRHGLVAAAFFLSIPAALQIAAWAYVDLTLTFYTFAGFYALYNWLESQVAAANTNQPASRPWGWLILAGLFSGAAAAIKYTGAAALLALGAVLLWAFVRRRLRARQFLVVAAILGVLTLLLAAPWYLRNWLVTGNPIYPLIWGGRGWNEVSTRWLLVLGEKKTPLDLLLIPWTLTIVGREGTLAYDATISPVFLLLLPLLLLVRRKAPGLAELALIAAVGYAAWIASGAASYGAFVLQGRMLLPVFAALSLLCAYALSGLDRWDRLHFSIQRVLTMLVTLTLGFGWLNQALVVAGSNPAPYLSGYQSAQQYQDEHITMNWNQARTYVNQNLAAGDKVLFFWEPRSYGFRVPHEPDPLFDNFSQLVARYGSVDGVLAGLRAEGVTHLLVNQFIYPWIVTDYPLTPEEQTLWEEFQGRYLGQDAVVYTDGEYLVLYRLPNPG
jgi:4-amino-4-deoxy-L-arabinose transferase-like glycosyltransferase